MMMGCRMKTRLVVRVKSLGRITRAEPKRRTG